MVLFQHLCDIFIQEHIIRTGHGSVSVIIYGDIEKPPLITYPDVSLNRKIFCMILYYTTCIVIVIFSVLTFYVNYDRNVQRSLGK